jgi:type IV secretion system protein VirD4
MLDNRFALLFVRGERPVKDDKYELSAHPNVKHTSLNGGAEYQHGEANNTTTSITFTELPFEEDTSDEPIQTDLGIYSEEEIEKLYLNN